MLRGHLRTLLEKNVRPIGGRLRRVAGLPTALLIASLLAAAPVTGQEEEAAGRLLMAAQQQLRDGNLSAALDEYAELLSRFPNSRVAPRALLDSASIHYRSGDLARADQLAQRVIDADGAGVEGAEAEVLRARIALARARDLDDVSEARMRLNRMPSLFSRERFPWLPARARALLLGARASSSLGDHGEALAGFLQALEDEPAGPWSPWARLGMARVLLDQEQWTAAAELLQEVLTGGTPAGDDLAPVAGRSAQEEARTLLTLLHRFVIRPLASEPRWRRARVLSLDNLKKPRAIAAALDGRLAIADPGANGLVQIRGQDDRGSLTSLPRSPGRPWFAADGSAYLATSDGVLSLATGALGSFTQPGDKPKPLSKIQGGATGSFGETLLIDRDVDGVAIFDRDGRPAGTLSVRDPIDVVTDFRGQIYVLTGRPGRVSVFGADHQPLRSFTVNANRPAGLDVDLFGNVYVVDESEAAIEVTGPQGSALRRLGPLLPGGVELRSPEDVAVDGLGRIYVADSRLSAVVVLD